MAFLSTVKSIVNIGFEQEALGISKDAFNIVAPKNKSFRNLSKEYGVLKEKLQNMPGEDVS